MLPDPNAILFNKNMITEYSLEDPYELVRDGEWTIYKMMEMASEVTSDNGDNIWNENDTYGLAAQDNWFLSSFIYSSGQTLLTKNSDGEFELAFGQSKTYDLMEKLYEMLHSPDTYVYPYNAREKGYTMLGIDSGRCLFNIETLNMLYTLRDCNVEYGILPYPKYDSNQEDYCNNDWSGLMCVPMTVKEPEMVGKAIELLNYYSADTTVPAYYDVVLNVKLARDEDSIEMLDIIFDNIVFDAGMNYLGFENNMNKLFYTPDFMLKSGYGGFASWFASYEKGTLLEIDDFNKALREIG